MIDFQIRRGVQIPKSGPKSTYVLEVRNVANGVEPFYKVGHSKNVAQRMASLIGHFRDGEPHIGAWPLELVYLCPFGPACEHGVGCFDRLYSMSLVATFPANVETKLHHHLDSFRVRDANVWGGVRCEWFEGVEAWEAIEEFDWRAAA